MATDVADWVKYVSPSVPLCPNPVIKRYVVDICRDFCNHTELWGDNELAAISLVADQPDYSISSALGDIVSIDHAEINEVPIRPMSRSMLNNQFNNWRHNTEKYPRGYMFDAADTMTLFYTPKENVADTLVVWVNLKPLETATSVQEFLWRDYRHDIAGGAIGRLLQVRNMPWTDIKLGMVEESRYESARNAARGKKFKGRTRLEMQAAPEFFC